MHRDSVISVRLPAQLAVDLKKAAHDGRYKDTSELVRHIVRHRWLQDQRVLAPAPREDIAAELERLLQKVRR